jgi:hypothetical protein
MLHSARRAISAAEQTFWSPLLQIWCKKTVTGVVRYYKKRRHDLSCKSESTRTRSAFLSKGFCPFHQIYNYLTSCRASIIFQNTCWNILPQKPGTSSTPLIATNFTQYAFYVIWRKLIDKYSSIYPSKSNKQRDEQAFKRDF